jgi:small subunit ribosomal protein S6
MTNENETIVEGGNENRVYEISYILVPTITEDAAAEKISSLKQSIADLGASFISEEEPYMRDLAYEMLRVIKNVNNRFDTGFFGWIKFELDPANLTKVEKILKLDEDVIRYIAVKADRNINIYTKKIVAKSFTEEVNIDTTKEVEVEALAEANTTEQIASN